MNPQKHALTDAGPVDRAVGFLSCGFRLPIDTHEAFFTHSVAGGGLIIAELRQATEGPQRAFLAGPGAVAAICPAPKARRVLGTRPDA